MANRVVCFDTTVEEPLNIFCYATRWIVVVLMKWEYMFGIQTLTFSLINIAPRSEKTVSVDISEALFALSLVYYVNRGFSDSVFKSASEIYQFSPCLVVIDPKFD